MLRATFRRSIHVKHHIAGIGRASRSKPACRRQSRLLGADARQHRRRLWRHRHQPALRACANRCWPRSGRTSRPAKPVVFGILSLIIWALLIVVTAKYVLILLRADNNGEGGTLALMALAQRALGAPRRLDHPARHHQRRAVLRRRDHHAGAVGALGRRRPEGRNAGLRALRRAAHGGDPGRAVCRAVARHRQGRGLLRPDHAGLVRRASRVAGLWHIAQNPSVLLAFNPCYGDRAFCSITA